MSKITIATPIYNHVEFIDIALNCILNQTMQDYVWMIMNDGSNDGTFEKLESLKSDKRIKNNLIILNREHRGFCKTFNELIKLVPTEYVAYYPMDDIIYPRYLEAFYNKTIGGYDLIIGDFYGRRGDNKPVLRGCFNPKPYGFGYMPPSVVVKKFVYGLYPYDPYPNEYLWEVEFNWTWFFCLINENMKYGYVEEPLFEHVRTSNNQGRRIGMNRIKEIDQIALAQLPSKAKRRACERLLEIQKEAGKYLKESK